MTKKQPAKRIQTLLDNLTQDFSIDKLSKSPARFNQAKLDWFNKEYFKLLSLPEFALRYSQWKAEYNWALELKQKIQKGELDKDYQPKFRTGDYVMLVDFKTQKVFACQDKYRVQDGQFFLIGGGFETGDPVANLVREMTEELGSGVNKDFQIDKTKILKVAEFKIWAKEKLVRDAVEFDGKEFRIYCLPVKENDLKPFVLKENQKNREFKWHSLAELIQTNQFLTYPLWQDFSSQNNLPLLKPTKEILTDYLALLLDKNRTSKFSEVGLDSDCVSNWQKPKDEDLKWKKLSLEESKKNLKEIWEAIKNVFYDKHTKLQEKFLLSILTDLLLNDKNPDIDSSQTNFDFIFWEVAGLWESEIKMWLTSGDKKAGDYLWSLRVALSGKKRSPSPFELLAVLPKAEVDRRIREALIINNE